MNAYLIPPSLRGRWLGKVLTAALLCVTPAVFADDPSGRELDRFFAASSPAAENSIGRLMKFRLLLRSLADASDNEKIIAVNRFFNQNIHLNNDITAWGLRDYWATPSQTLSRGMGDCDDFATAKFLTLLELGVSRSKLRLMVVKPGRSGATHMVVSYTSPSGEVLLLDNLSREPRAASLEETLRTVYSLDGRNIWMSDARGVERRVGNANSLAQWRGLLTRIPTRVLAKLDLAR